MTEISEVGDIRTGGQYLYSLSVKQRQVFTINFQFPILASQNRFLTPCTQDTWIVLIYFKLKEHGFHHKTHVMITRKRHKSKNRRYRDTFRNIDIDHPCIGMFWSSLIAECWYANAEKRKNILSAVEVFIYLWLLAKRNMWRRLWEIAARDR